MSSHLIEDLAIWSRRRNACGESPWSISPIIHNGIPTKAVWTNASIQYLSNNSEHFHTEKDRSERQRLFHSFHHQLKRHGWSHLLGLKNLWLLQLQHLHSAQRGLAKGPSSTTSQDRLPILDNFEYTIPETAHAYWKSCLSAACCALLLLLRGITGSHRNNLMHRTSEK